MSPKPMGVYIGVGLAGFFLGVAIAGTGFWMWKTRNRSFVDQATGHGIELGGLHSSVSGAARGGRADGEGI